MVLVVLGTAECVDWITDFVRVESCSLWQLVNMALLAIYFSCYWCACLTVCVYIFVSAEILLYYF